MDGLSSGSGVFCGTVAGSGSHTKGSGSHTNNSVCSSSAVTGGKFTETLTHFGGSGDDWTRIGTATNINDTSAEIKGILVDTNGHLAKCPFVSTKIPLISADVSLIFVAVPILVQSSPDPPKCVKVSVNFPPVTALDEQTELFVCDPLPLV
mgnify:FL=1